MSGSPLSAMIDRACGITPEQRAKWNVLAKRGPVVLACSNCAAEKTVGRDECDPASAAFIVYPCDKCRHRRAGKEAAARGPLYFTALGLQLRA